MNCSMPGFPVLHYLPEFAQTHALEPVMLSNHLILCCPLPLLPLTFPSIRVFSNELALHIRWPKYWSFSFRISPSSEYSGLISRPLAFLFFLKISWWLVADIRILLNVYFREWNPLHFPYQQIMWFHSLSHRLRCLGMLLFITQGHVLLHRTPRGSTQKGAVKIWR